MMPAIHDIVVFPVDVRDVAEAHYQALIRENLHGERILVTHTAVKMKDIV